MFEEPPTADLDQTPDDVLEKTDKEPLSTANNKTEQSNDELFSISPKIVLQEVQHTVRERDKVNINLRIDQEGNGCNELETSQIQIPKVDTNSGQDELGERIEQIQFHRKEQTEKHISLKSALNLSTERSPEFYLLPKVINGGIAGIVSVSILYPLDFVKTKLQAQVPGRDGQLPYKSIFDCFKKTVKTEGYFGVYRGSVVNIVLVTPEKAIKLAANDYFRHHLTKPNGELPLLRQMLAGGLAGLFQAIISTPMELLKIRMQMCGMAVAEANVAGKPVTQLTPFSVVTTLIKENGLLGLYKGVTITMFRVVLFSVIYFPLFATFNEVRSPSLDGSEGTLFWRSFVSGAAAGAISAFSVTPADVVKTRLQNAREVQGVAPEYLGIADCFGKTIRKEGVRAF